MWLFNISGVTAEILIDAVDSACSRLAYKFRFGYHEVEDMRQEAYILSLEVIRQGKWDQKRSLRAFIYTHLHNRFYNFKRKHYLRLAPPCEKCPLAAYRASDDTCLAYDSKDDCRFYVSWTLRNESKRSLMQTVDLAPNSHPHKNPNLVTDDKDELNKLREILPPEYHETWDRHLSGLPTNSTIYKQMVAWVHAHLEGEKGERGA